MQYQLFEYHGGADSIFGLYLGTLSSVFGSETNHIEDVFSSARAETKTLNMCHITAHL